MDCNKLQCPSVCCNRKQQLNKTVSSPSSILSLMQSWIGSSLAGFLIFGGAHSAAQSAPLVHNLSDGLNKQEQSVCPEPALFRLTRHRIVAGETLESIAQRYNLLPTTLMGLNPVLRQGAAPIGTEISIPPYNGIRVSVPAGSSWRDIAKQYNVRADVLFEANGCQNAPEVVFVPGVNWSPVPSSSSSASTTASSPIERYPLPQVASIVLAYGWQVSPNTGALMFHSGVNLAAEAGTPVYAVGAGTVAFAGSQDGSGKLVVINHAQGLQTRYAQLETISVKVGQQIQSGAQLGTIGVGAPPLEPYLHFEVRSNSRLGWVAQDPGAYIRELRVGRSAR